MNSDEVFDLIEDVAATSSKTGKQALIEQGRGDVLFSNVLLAALDPFVTYGMAKVSVRDARGGEGVMFDGNTWEMLNRMALRQLTGTAAQNEVGSFIDRLTPKSSELLRRIITKDLRAGFSESTVNKAIPGLIPTFDCMLAHKFEAKRIKSWPQFVEPKLDGVRVLAFVNLDTYSVKFFSRSGKEFTTFEHLKQPLMNMLMAAKLAARSMVFDGEIVSGSFNKTVGDVRRKSEQATDAEFHVFDVLPIEAFEQEGKGGCAGGTYIARRNLLKDIVGAETGGPIKLIQRYAVNSEVEIHHVYESVRARGLEGLIVKDPAGLYHRRRNHGWMKLKNESEVDVQIVRLIEGTGKYVGALGALVVDFNGVEVSVGSGLSDQQREEFWVEGDNLIGRLCAVEYHEETPDGSLRHPRFVKWRDDKPVSDGVGV